ncbi:MAG: hypothetical protein JNK88_06505, partial [Mangrovicoccus sp.]|nr:hypothetical protein [Mangrovicoccus sp.]
SLNVHLEKLEAAGLIRRERRHEEGTHKRKSTRYLLRFEDDFGAEPCPDSGHGNGQKPCPDFAKSHVQNLDTNLVREPVTKNARDARAGSDPEPACRETRCEGLRPESRGVIGTSPDPPASVALIADWINSGRYVPPCAVSSTMRASLLAAGLVTEAALRARQIY